MTINNEEDRQKIKDYISNSNIQDVLQKLSLEDKLYNAIEAAIIGWNFDKNKTAGSLTREIMSIIKLPTEEEINKESFIVNPPKLQNDYSKEYYDDNIQYREEWVDGAKWVVNLIKQQDNE
jgi:hypothetical protein